MIQATQERFTANEQKITPIDINAIDQLATALSKAQGEFPNILKSEKAKIRTKSGGEYTYTYADLAVIIEATKLPLSRNGLAVSQCSSTTEKSVNIHTRLMHNSGQWIQNVLSLPIVDTGNNIIQAIGSSITYGRRYELCSILGISAEDDDEANSVGKNKETYKPKAAPIKPTDQIMPLKEIKEDDMNRVLGKAKANGWTSTDVKNYIEGLGYAPTEGVPLVNELDFKDVDQHFGKTKPITK